MHALRVRSNFVLIPPSGKATAPALMERTGAVADREGFEPSIPFLVYSLSRGALSTTQPPVLGGVVVDDGRSWNIYVRIRQGVMMLILQIMGSRYFEPR